MSDEERNRSPVYYGGVDSGEETRNNRHPDNFSDKGKESGGEGHGRDDVSHGWNTTSPNFHRGLAKSRTPSPKEMAPRRGDSWDQSVAQSPSPARARSPEDITDKEEVATSPWKTDRHQEISSADGSQTRINQARSPDSQSATRHTTETGNVKDLASNDVPDVEWSESMVIRAYLKHSRQSSPAEAGPAPPSRGRPMLDFENNDKPKSTASNRDLHNDREDLITSNSLRPQSQGIRTPPNLSRMVNNSAFTPRPPSKARKSSKSSRSRRYQPRLSVISRDSVQYKDDFLDENLLISASKLDSTLLRLFSGTRKGKKEEDPDDPCAKLMPFLNYSQSDLISMEPVFWRVYPMDSVQKETLDQEMTFIEENVNPRDILNRLYQVEALTLMDYNQITRTEGQGEKAVTRLLVKTLQRRGDKAYPALLSALESSDYTHVCAKLADTEAVLRQGMKEDRDAYSRRLEMMRDMSRWNVGSRATPSREPLMSRRASEQFVPSSAKVLSATKQRLVTPVTEEGPYPGHVTSASQRSPFHHVTSVEAQEGPPNQQQQMESEQLENYLRNLKAELEALHDDVTALKTARSPSVGAARSPSVGAARSPSIREVTIITMNKTILSSFHPPYITAPAHTPASGDNRARAEENEVMESVSENPADSDYDVQQQVDVDTQQHSSPGVRAQKSSTCTLL